MSIAGKILNTLKGTELEVKVCLLEEDVPIGSLITLGPGSVFRFKESSKADAYLCVGGKKVASGVVVRKGEYYGFRVKRVNS